MTPNLTGSERYFYQKAKAADRVAKRTEEAALAERVAVNRDPCEGCGVPAHRHDEHGCSGYWVKRYG